MGKLTQSEKCQYVLFILYYSFPFWFNLFIAKLPMAFVVAHLILFLPAICLLLLKSKHLIQYIDIFGVYFIVLVLFLFKFMVDSSMAPWYKEQTYSVYRFLLYPGSGIFAYAVIRLTNRKDVVLKSFRVIGFLLFAYYTIQSLEVIQNGYFVYEIFGEERVSKYNISFGYGMFTAIVFLTVDYVKFRKIYVLPFIVVGLIEVLSFGSRAPTVMYLLFVIVLILFYSNYDSKSKTQRRRLLSVTIILLIAVWLFYLDGLVWIFEMLSKFGIESRTLIAFFNGTMSDDNGRNEIWEKVIELIQQRPLVGYGVFGERNAVYRIGMRWGYSHNIFLEILVDFGIPLGFLIILLGGSFLLKILMKPRDKDYQLLMLGFFAISMELLLSNSFWFHIGFWSLLGLAYNYKRENHKKFLSLKTRKEGRYESF